MPGSRLVHRAVGRTKQNDASGNTMTQGNQQSNLLIKVLGSAALAGFVAIAALVWSIYSSRSEELAMERQLANQATQIAKQDVQIDLNAEQNRLMSEQATVAVQKASIEDQLRTPLPTNSADFAPTATALAIQSIQIEATRQAIEDKQGQIGATQTAIAQPPEVAQPQTPTASTSAQGSGPLREHKETTLAGTGVLARGTYSDGMAPFGESDTANHHNIQRIRLEENPDGCGIAFLDADKIWFGSSVQTNLTINNTVVGGINGPTGKHGYIFDIAIHRGDRICVTYFEPSGFQIVFGPDIYYHYDSYCYRGHC